MLATLSPQPGRGKKLGDFTAQLVLDMGFDDCVEVLLCLEAEFGGALGVEAFRPAGNDAHDELVRMAPDARGEARVCRTVSATGRNASCPASGSRMMPEKKPEAALFVLPGRTQMVGRRMPTPSRK